MLGAVLSVELERRYGLASPQVPLAYTGITFVVSSLGRPWWLYATIRRMGWFASIENDTHMRVLLALFGAVLLIAGLAADGG